MSKECPKLVVLWPVEGSRGSNPGRALQRIAAFMALFLVIVL